MAWSPWAAAAAYPNLRIRFAELPDETGGACLARRGEALWIILDPRLDRAHRTARLAHELVHLERGTSARCAFSPRSWDAIVVREELLVDREVARRLVPRDDLRCFVEQAQEHEGVDARMVADRFGVPVQVASVALHELGRAVRLN
jgi:Zn-dependent peptidase ImmA (M78 family)